MKNCQKAQTDVANKCDIVDKAVVADMDDYEDSQERAMTTHEEAACVPITEQDQREVQALYKELRRGEAKLVGPDGKAQSLPPNLYSFLCRLLGDLKAGKSVTLLQNEAELTTVESAKLLAVSRQFLIGLLDQHQIPYHMVGTHRRIYARDILAYKGRRDSARRKTLDDLARAEYEEGIYNQIPLTGQDEAGIV
jgi:excisionase family DNA binding protein